MDQFLVRACSSVKRNKGSSCGSWMVGAGMPVFLDAPGVGCFMLRVVEWKPRARPRRLRSCFLNKGSLSTPECALDGAQRRFVHWMACC